MKRSRYAQILVVLPMVWMVGCAEYEGSDHVAPDRQVVMGDQGLLDGGKVKSWAAMDADFRIIELGLTLSPEAMVAARGDFASMRLPVEALMMSDFDHVAVEIADARTQPGAKSEGRQFLLHFYLLTAPDREAITCEPTQMPDQAAVPHDFQIPGSVVDENGNCFPGLGIRAVEARGEGYDDEDGAQGPGGAPSIGLAVDFADGDIAAITPMIAQSALISGESFSHMIPVPEATASTRAWPTTVKGWQDAETGEYKIVLQDFVVLEP